MTGSSAERINRPAAGTFIPHPVNALPRKAPFPSGKKLTEKSVRGNPGKVVMMLLKNDAVHLRKLSA